MVRGLLLLCCLLLSFPAFAQELDGERNRITNSSDVMLSLEGGPGTNRARLQELGSAVGGALGAIRRCYRERVEEDSTVQGSLNLEVSVDNGGSATVRITRDGLDDARLSQCVVRALERASYADVGGRGIAFATLQFQNSAAEGVQRTRERSSEEANVQVQQTEEGRFQVEGGTPDGLIHFRAVGGPRSDETHLRALHQALRAAIPVMLDCRRKSARRSSPEGETELVVVIGGNQRADVRVVRSTVESPRGPRCLDRGLSRIRFPESARGRARLFVRFGVRPDMDAVAPASDSEAASKRQRNLKPVRLDDAARRCQDTDHASCGTFGASHGASYQLRDHSPQARR